MKVENCVPARKPLPTGSQFLDHVAPGVLYHNIFDEGGRTDDAKSPEEETAFAMSTCDLG